MSTFTVAQSFTGDTTLSSEKLTNNFQKVKEYLNGVYEWYSTSAGSLDHNNISTTAGLSLSQLAEKHSLCFVTHTVNQSQALAAADYWLYFRPPPGARLMEIRVMGVTSADAYSAETIATLKVAGTGTVKQTATLSSSGSWSRKVFHGDDMEELDHQTFYKLGFETGDVPAGLLHAQAQIILAVPLASNDVAITE